MRFALYPLYYLFVLCRTLRLSVRLVLGLELLDADNPLHLLAHLNNEELYGIIGLKYEVLVTGIKDDIIIQQTSVCLVWHSCLVVGLHKF